MTGIDDGKISPELCRRLAEANINGPAEREWKRQWRMVDQIADLLSRVSEAEAASWFDDMARADANPTMLDYIRMARALMLSSEKLS